MAIIRIPTSIGGINIPGSLLEGPLAALFRVAGLESLKYPRDLQSSTRGHVVRFTIKEVKPVDFADLENRITSGLKDIQSQYDTGQLSGNASELGKKLLNDAKSGAVDVINSVARNGLVSVLSAFGKSSGDKIKQFTTQETKDVAHIFLYMPDTVNFNYSPNYDDGVSLASAAGAIPVVGPLIKGGTDLLSGNDAVRLVLNRAGYVFNPNQQLLFQGVSFRTFEMSFTFTPKSRQEAEDVKRIVKMFRAHAAPTIVEEAAGMFFRPPSIFEFEFLYNGARNKNLPKFSRCVIENIDVNYAPNGWAAHDDGAPVQSTMTLQFKEMVIIDKKAIEKEN